MSSEPLDVPEDVVRMMLAAEGDAGRAWLAALPALVGALRERWSLRLGPAYPGGNVAYVAPATLPDGTRAVLKVSLLGEENRHEGEALRLFAGEGAVRLLAADEARGALLLERAEPGHSLHEHPDREEAISIACRLLRRLWRPPPARHPFPLVRELAARLADEIPAGWERAGRPFERALARRAAALAAELAEERELFLANRDYHLGNVLAARREPWLAIDPKPLAGERAFDTGHFLRDLLPSRLDAVVSDRLVERLAAELALPPERVRAWAFVRSVSNALWSIETGLGDPGRDLGWARLLAP
jgi:streptomycin 6-kinase